MTETRSMKHKMKCREKEPFWESVPIVIKEYLYELHVCQAILNPLKLNSHGRKFETVVSPALSPVPLTTLLIPFFCYSSHHSGQRTGASACRTYTEHRTHCSQARALTHTNQTKENKAKEAEHITSLAEPRPALAFVSEASI